MQRCRPSLEPTACNGRSVAAAGSCNRAIVLRAANVTGDLAAKIMCRIGPANAGFSHNVSGTGEMGDCVVDLRELELRARHADLSNRSLRGHHVLVTPESGHSSVAP